ncbi:histidine kinase [Paenibacillus sp. JX-17]|uniref:Histidine kinase n=1 Tax=Paenibacillus lacisoli TaxID=3064525 RepID=A0ABT9CHA1_9BACL|nr:histidine kinase [Paenibacillus sp. JX-17]MDO7908625.1 histidine kinase [Paenibacillus sp. JX-17]
MMTMMIFAGIVIPIIAAAILLMLRILDNELDVLELENVKVRLEKELQQSEYNQLSEKIQPHFLFNSLNAFMSLSRLGRHQDMIQGMEQFSMFLRYRYQERGNLVPFRSELEHTRHYLAIQQLRFGPRLHISYDLDPIAIGSLIPPFTLQTLVENAFKHGLEQTPGDKHCRITLLRESNWVTLKVIDNGGGAIAPNHAGGIGLSNLRRRFALLFDLTSSLTLEKNAEGATEAAVSWPYVPEGDIQ